MLKVLLPLLLILTLINPLTSYAQQGVLVPTQAELDAEKAKLTSELQAIKAAIAAIDNKLSAALVNLNAEILAIKTRLAALETSDPDPNPEPEPPTFNQIRVYTGNVNYTDSRGNVWLADRNFAGGSFGNTNLPIGNTVDDVLYQTERWGTFSYNFPVPNGNYEVELKFAEIYWSFPKQRIFDVSIEGKLVLDDLDILAQVGRANALDRTFTTFVTDGSLNISFGPAASDQPKIAAISIRASGIPPTPEPVLTYVGEPSNELCITTTQPEEKTLTWDMFGGDGSIIVEGYHVLVGSSSGNYNLPLIAAGLNNTITYNFMGAESRCFQAKGYVMK